MAQYLDHSPAQITARVLIDLGLGAAPATTTTTWPIGYSKEPDLPENAVTVYSTIGTEFSRHQVDGRINANFGIQVRVRAQDERTGWVKADAIRRGMAESVRLKSISFDGKSYVVWSFNRIGQVLVLGAILPAKLLVWTVNAQAVIRAL